MKLIKIISRIIFALMVIVLFFTIKQNKKLNTQLDYSNQLVEKYKESDSTSKLAYDALLESKTKTLIYYEDKIGTITKDYSNKLKQKDNLIKQYANKPADTIKIPVVYANIETLTDSLKTPDLKLNYVMQYAGMIYDIKFDYVVKEKITVKKSIVYVPKPYPVEKLVSVNKRMLYVGASISTFKDVSVSFGAMYLDKKRKAYMFNYDPINKSYQFGCYYKLF